MFDTEIIKRNTYGNFKKQNGNSFLCVTIEWI